MPDWTAAKGLVHWKVSLTEHGNLFAECPDLELSTFAPTWEELDERIRQSMELLFQELAESGDLISYLMSRGQALMVWADAPSQVPDRVLSTARDPVEEMPFVFQVKDEDGRTRVVSL